MEKELKKIAWREAATGGLYLGVTFAGIGVLNYVVRANDDLQWLPGLLNFMALVVFIYVYARRMAFHYGEREYSYPQSLGFVFRMMLFSGVLAGLGQFIMQTYVDPPYYLTLAEKVLVEQFKITPDKAAEMMQQSASMMSPLLMVLSGVFMMLLYGGLVGLLVSAFVRKRTYLNPPQDTDESQPDTAHSHDAN